MKKVFSWKKTFTLKRLVIAVAIIVSLAIITAPRYIKNSRNNAAIELLQQISLAEILIQTDCIAPLALYTIFY